MYSNMKYYENICNCLRVIQQDINRKLNSANCWQRTSLKHPKIHLKTILLKRLPEMDEIAFSFIVGRQFHEKKSDGKMG